jgi:uncharacterized protein (TIGR02996 family)
MLSDATFLAAIAADPEDVSRRLIYADWLEEQGDGRAEFIRLMEEMRTLLVHSDRFAALRPRRNELRQQLAPEWITRMGYQPTHRPMFTKLPEKRHERWRLVEEFIDIWYGPLQSGDGYSEEELQEVESRLGVRLPAALREWYGLAGKRDEVWSKQDPLVYPGNLTLLPGDTLVIRNENQRMEAWGIMGEDIAKDDPPIYLFSYPWKISPTLSAFALRVLVYDSVLSGHVRLNRDYFRGAATVDEISSKFTLCDLPERYYTEFTTRFFEGADIIIQINDAEDRQSLEVAALNEAACNQLSERLRKKLRRDS